MTSDVEDRDLVPVTVRLPETLVDSLDRSVADAPDWMGLSRAELLRHAVEHGTEDWSETAEELVPPEMLAEYRLKREHERQKAKYYVVDFRETWRDRVAGRFRGRLKGPEPVTPEGIRYIAAGYEEELRSAHRLSPESSRTLEQDLEWLDRKLEGYRDAYRAKQAVPDSEPFSGVEAPIDVGRDLLQLAEDPVETVEHVEEVAEGEGYDPDAILRRLEKEWAVSPEALETILDVLTTDDTLPREALRDGDGLRSNLDGRVLDDHGGAVDPSALESAEIISDDSPPDAFDDGSPTSLTVEVNMDDLDDGTVTAVDPEAVDDLLDSSLGPDDPEEVPEHVVNGHDPRGEDDD